MELNSEFIKAVAEKNINNVRSYIYTSFTVSPKSSEAEEMIKYAESKLKDLLYKKQDGQKLNREKLNWTENYYKQLLKDLMFNFSKERIDLLVEVRKHVFGTSHSSVKENTSSYQASNIRFNNNKNNGNSIDNKQIGTVVAGVGGVLLVGGFIVKSFAVGAIGGAAIIVGGLLIIGENNK